MIKNFTKNNEKVIELFCGQAHTLAITNKLKLYSWGEAQDGQLGLGYDEASFSCLNVYEPLEVKLTINKNEEYIASAACGNNFSLVSFKSGYTKMFGKGKWLRPKFDDHLLFSIPFPISEDISIMRVSAGSDHYVLQDNFWRLYSSGKGSFGCLGHGDANKRSVPFYISFFEENRIIDFACGENFTVVLAENYNMNER